MPLINVQMLSESAPGTVTQVEVCSAPYAICNVNGTLYCVDGHCPHAGGPLGQGDLEGHSLVCPWHGWQFDCRTGLSDHNGAQVATYPVLIREGCILIDFPSQNLEQLPTPVSLSVAALPESQTGGG
jgi:nitrite reductase (NADH) small subunit